MILRDFKIEVAVLIIILLTAAFFRFYRLGEYMTFLGDEGRDMLIMQNILREGDLPFIGPASSVGSVYLGPLYYYLLAGSMLVLGLNPVVGAGMVASIGVATVFLVYFLGRLLFNRWSALLAAWLYGISPVTITASKSSWNPHPAPFFTLLVVWTFYRGYTTNSWRWLVLTGAFTSAAVQMHYLTLPLIPAILILMIYKYLSEGRKDLRWLTRGMLGFVVSFNLVFLPWWLFEIKHDFLNFRGILEIFFGANPKVGVTEGSLLEKFWTASGIVLVGDFLTSGMWMLTILIIMVLTLQIIKALMLPEFAKRRLSYILLAGFLGVGLLLVSLYRGPVYTHYVGFLAPLMYLLCGSTSYFLLTKKSFWLGRILGGDKIVRTISLAMLVLLVGVLSYLNLSKNPNRYPPNNQLERTIQISRYVIERGEGQPYNFALIAKNNYDSAYQFYLEQLGHKPRVVQVERAGQLFVVCEDLICEPINHPKAEIAGFGWAKVEAVSEFNGVKVFKLVPNPSGRPS